MIDRQHPVLYIVIPCYNEQQVLPVTAPMFFAKLRGLMADGLIAEQGTPEQVFEHPENERTRAFLGHFAQNN